MHRNVELLIGRLATDPKLRRRFAANPEAVLLELAGQGLELSEIELEALAATAPDAIRSFAAALDARLRKASPGDESASASERPDPQSPTERKN
ncbi:MAG: Os1348 family NHLP clan protein [Thermoanaerobaculia bacterium]